MPTNAVLPSAPDISTIATNLVILVAAVSATVAGVWKALRDVKKVEANPPKTSSEGLVDSATRLVLQEIVHAVVEALKHNTESNHSLKREVMELHHQIERLRDLIR